MKYKDNERAYHREYQRSRYAADPDKARAYQREWKNRKYVEDPAYREKVLARNKARVKARTIEYKLLTRLKRYSLNFHDYAVMYARQYGLCNICGRHFKNLFDSTLNIDHDHNTNLEGKDETTK